MKTFQHLRVEMVPRPLIITDPKNAREHDDEQIALIVALIKRFGPLPIIIDHLNMVAAGHGRLKAMDALNFEEIPVIRKQFKSDADRRAFALADNRVAELSTWNMDLVTSELNILFESGYDIGITGFKTADLDIALADDVINREPEAAEAPNPAAKAITRPDDRWTIGPHSLYCGTSSLAFSFEQLLGDEVADIVFSDPPFNVPIDRHVSGLGKHKHREFGEASGEKTPAEFMQFLRGGFRNCVHFSKNGSIHYHCMDWRHIREILDAADGVYTEFKQLAVWNKDNAGMGSFYRSKYELVFIFKSGTAKHVNNFGLGDKGRYRTNVWDYAGANSFRKGRARDLADHPTVKPIPLVADALLDCSNRGDLVLDPFSGSGTTLIAAHKTGRRGAAIELDPLYCDVSIRRLMAASGLDAVRQDGRRFVDLEREASENREATDDEA